MRILTLAAIAALSITTTTSAFAQTSPEAFAAAYDTGDLSPGIMRLSDVPSATPTDPRQTQVLSAPSPLVDQPVVQAVATGEPCHLLGYHDNQPAFENAANCSAETIAYYRSHRPAAQSNSVAVASTEDQQINRIERLVKIEDKQETKRLVRGVLATIVLGGTNRLLYGSGGGYYGFSRPDANQRFYGAGSICSYSNGYGPC